MKSWKKWSRHFFLLFLVDLRLSDVVMSSQTGMNPCVKWCNTSHPSLGWLFCDLKMVENMLNHQIEMFCNKSRPWLAMVWVIPGWDDPHWPTFNMPPMQNIVRPVVAMHNKHVHLKLIKFWVLFLGHGNTCSSQSGMNPCVQWCPTSHPSLGWLFCEKWWKNTLNHQIVLFCNKYRPWLAMVWVIPGWDDPR